MDQDADDIPLASAAAGPKGVIEIGVRLSPRSRDLGTVDASQGV